MEEIRRRVILIPFVIITGLKPPVKREIKLRNATYHSADREIRLLSCDYAERVLPLFEEKYPDDNRPRICIETSRAYANSQATIEELQAVAEAASWVAREAEPKKAMWFEF